MKDLRDRLARCEEALALERAARAEADQRASAALCLFAAAWRLGQASNAAQVHAALEEIAAVVLAPERATLLLRRPGAGPESLELAPAPGERAGRAGTDLPGRAIAERALSGRTVTVDRGPQAVDVAVPLLDGEVAVGALVLFGVRPRPGAPWIDQLEVLDIVGRQAGPLLRGGAHVRRQP